MPSRAIISGKPMHHISIVAMSLMLAMAAAPAAAAELTVLVGGSLAAIMKDLTPGFERATGHRLVMRFAGTTELIRQATSGAAFDLGVVPAEVMQDKAARATFGPIVEIARAGYGIAVRAGAARPDISTPAAFKAALLQAQSYALYPESAGGAYVMKVFERLGIAEAMKPKLKAQAGPGDIVTAVARGDAELGIFVTHVLVGPGVELVGPFPAELQQDLVFVGALAANTKNAGAGQAFIDYLKTPAAAAAFKARGLTPG